MYGRETGEKLKGFPGRFKYQAEAGNYETALSHPSIVMWFPLVANPHWQLDLKVQV